MQEMSFEFELDEESKKKLNEFRRGIEQEIQETLESALTAPDMVKPMMELHLLAEC